MLNILVIILLSSLAVQSQIYIKPNNSYGVIQNRGRDDSTRLIPTFCGAPAGKASLHSIDQKMSALYYDSCGRRFYVYNPSDSSWTKLGAIQLTDSSFKVGVDTITIRGTGGGGGGTPAGSNTQVQFNDAGAFGGDAGFTYNKINNTVTTDSVVVIKGNIDTIRTQVTLRTSAKKAYFFGTSITKGYYTQDAAGGLDTMRRWSTYVSRSLGLTEKNYGVPSQTMQRRSPVVTNMVDNGIPLIPIYNINTDTAIILECGINDCTHTGQGETNYNTTNFITDYTRVIDTIKARGWPDAQIYIIASNYVDTALNLFNNYTNQLAYYNATKAVAVNEGVNLIDVFTNSYINRTHFFHSDGLHPSNVGHSIYAIKVLQYIGASVKKNDQTIAANGPVEFQKIRIKQTDTTAIDYQIIGIDQYNNAIKIPNGFFVENNPLALQYGGINMYGDIKGTRLIGNMVQANGNRIATNLTGSGPELYWDGTASYLSSLQETPSVAWKPLNINAGGSYIGLGAIQNGIDGINTLSLKSNGYIRAKGAYPTTFEGGDEVFMGITGNIGYFAAFNGTGLTGRPLSINYWGGSVMIGSNSDNGSKLQVNGNATVSDDAYDATTWNGNLSVPTKNAIRDKIESLGSGNGIYGGSGSLPGNVTVTGSNNSITFDDIFAFRLKSDFNVISKANGTGIFTEAIIGAPNMYEIGYTPVEGVYSKGAGVFIDTNENVGIGSQPPTTMPLYATGSSLFVQGFQSNRGNFLRVDNITSNVTINENYSRIIIDATSGNITITLPAASAVFGNSMGIYYILQRIDNSGNTVTIQRAGSDTVNGGTSFTLTAQYQVKQLQCTSTSAWAQW